jgi:hypothetical protein
MGPLRVECDGCGRDKISPDTGEATDSVVCCDACWERLPAPVRDAFMAAVPRRDGPAPEETALRQWLVDHYEDEC